MFAWHQTLQMCPEQTLTSPATSPTCLPCTASAVLTNYRAKSRLETSSANLEIDTNRGERRLFRCYFHFTVHVINNLLKTSLPSELTWHCYCKSCLILGLTQNYKSSEVANYFSIDDRPCWTDRDRMTKVSSYLLQTWEHGDDVLLLQISCCLHSIIATLQKYFKGPPVVRGTVNFNSSLYSESVNGPANANFSCYGSRGDKLL